MLAGSAAGLLTWFVSDASGLMRFPDQVRTLSAAEARQQYLICMIFGGLVGTLLGLAEGVMAGSSAHMSRAAGIGAIVGVVSGLLGLVLAQPLFGALYVTETESDNPFTFLRNVVARALGWGFIGALAGTSDGWRKGSFRVGRNGLMGGLIGGLIGGTTFEIVPYLTPGWSRPGILSRLLGFVITGASIGLFVALVQQLLKQAWVRVVVGRNEGKEYLVEKAETRIGRAELSDIPLFGDPSVARTHAVLAARPGGLFVLRDTGSETRTHLNGQPVAGETPVRDGDQITIGSHRLIFHERPARGAAPVPNRDVAPPRPAASSLPSLGDALPAPVGNGALSTASVPRDERSPQGIEGRGAGPRLVVTAGPHLGKIFMPSPGAVIGRDPASEIALPADSKTSRAHARLLREAQNYIIEDMGSTNGTFVNGQRVTRQALAPGDTVLVGSTALRIE